MSFLKKSMMAMGIALLFAGLTQSVQAQVTKQDVAKEFNKGYDAYKNGNYEQAFKDFQQTINMAKQAKNASDIQQKAEEQLPPIQFQIAAGYYQKGQFDQSIDAFQKAGNLAKQYGNKNIAARVNSIIPKLYFAKGNNAFQNKDYQDAMKAYNQALNIDSTYAKAYYQKGLVYKNMYKKNDNKTAEQAVRMWDKAIALGKKTSDNATVRRAQAMASAFLVYVGSEQLDGKSYDASINTLKKSLNYNNSNADAYYRLAQAYNKKRDWSTAVNYGEKALSYEKGSRTDKAKIYYEIGTAQQGLNNKVKACSAFEQAAVGSFKASAEHIMEYELKCKSATASN